MRLEGRWLVDTSEGEVEDEKESEVEIDDGKGVVGIENRNDW